MPKPHVVSLVCTKEDLVDLREVAKDRLESIGFEVRAFDEDSYPYISGIDPAETTVAIAHLPDVQILVVDKRYGKVGSNGLSITENEWTSATNRTFILPFVRTNTIHEMKNWKSQGRPDAWRCQYVDDTAVLKFVEKVRGNTEWVSEFGDAVEFGVQLEARLRSLGISVFRRLGHESLKAMRRRKTVSVHDSNLALGDVLDRGIFVSPPFRVVTGTVSSSQFEEQLSQASRSRHRSIIIGDPGSGKSTALGKLFLDRYASTKASLTACLYVDCRKCTPQDLNSVQKLVSSLFDQYLDKTLWPLFDPTDSNYTLEFYFDALDEIAGEAVAVSNCVQASPIWDDFSHVATCRADFYSRVVLSQSVADRYDAVIELLLWDDQEITRYIEIKFANDIDRIAALKDLIWQQNLIGLARTPIGLIMLCSLDRPSEIDDRAELYAEFLRKWANREISKVSGGEKVLLNENTVFSIWKEIAWATFTRKLPKKFSVGDGHLVFGEFDKRTDIMATGPVKSLYDVRMEAGRELLSDVIHPSINEFLIASALSERIKESKLTAFEALEQDAWYEVNEFVQTISNQWNETDGAKVFDTLSDLYLMRKFDNSPGSLLSRNKAIYYIGRLCRKFPILRSRVVDFLDSAWSTENTVFVRQSLGFSRAMAGIPGAARAFVQEMQSSEELDRSNRGYHLVYYGDLRGVLPPFEDTGNTSWQQSRSALLRRLSGHRDHLQDCRAVDLFTYMRFIETRGAMLTQDEATLVESLRDEANRPGSKEGDLIIELTDRLKPFSVRQAP